jgi:hypothetical protein
MAKKVYEPNADATYSVALPSGKAILLDKGERYETSDEDEQRALDAQAELAGSGLKAVKSSKGGDS